MLGDNTEGGVGMLRPIGFRCVGSLYFNWTALYVQSDTKKRKLLKNPTKIEEIQGKKLLTEIEPLQLAF